jgi:hypothetical protein
MPPVVRSWEVRSEKRRAENEEEQRTKSRKDEEMKRWRDEEMKRWRDEEMKRWRDEEMKRWRDEEMRRWGDDQKRGIRRMYSSASEKLVQSGLMAPGLADCYTMRTVRINAGSLFFPSTWYCQAEGFSVNSSSGSVPGNFKMLQALSGLEIVSSASGQQVSSPPAC